MLGHNEKKGFLFLLCRSVANYTQIQFLTQLKSDFSSKFYGFTNGNFG